MAAAGGEFFESDSFGSEFLDLGTGDADTFSFEMPGSEDVFAELFADFVSFAKTAKVEEHRRRLDASATRYGAFIITTSYRIHYYLMLLMVVAISVVCPAPSILVPLRLF